MRFKLLSIALCLFVSLAATAANTKEQIAQVNESVQLSADIDYIITGTKPFTTTGSVDIVNTEHAVLIIANLKPSQVISRWLSNVYINGEKAVDGENCQVKMYGRGTIIFPYSKDMSPLTCYTEQNFGGESCSDYTEGHSGGYMKTLNASLLNNQIRSFKLKRGYMVTFAIGTSGWGYSRCFIADQEDLEVKTLPSILDQRISSYRIFKWFNAHKAGIAESNDLNVVNALNASWCYRMWPDPQGLDFRPDCEYVPHHYKENYPTYGSLGTKEFSCHIKGNNEPGNSADEAPCDVDAVLANWEDAMRTGMRLLSESSHDGSMNHLKAFIDSIDARGWRCDVLDLHCYWTTGQYNSLTWYSDNYGNGRPIWVSEWIWGASWNRNGAFGDGVTDSQIISETNNLLNILNNNPRVERYAYWNSESKARIYNNGLTELGKDYAVTNAGLGYNPANEFIPKDTRLEGLSELTNLYNRKNETVALSWSDPNGDLIGTINVQCKLPGESLFKTIATIKPKDKNSANGVSYAYTDTVSESGAYTYRIQAVAHNNKKITTDEVTINVAPSKGTDNFQYGKLSVGDIEATTTYYSEDFDETPYVFIGSATNKNSKFQAGNIVKNNRTNFTFQFLPWATSKENTLSSPEEVPFMAMKEGNYKFDELDCEVGCVSSNKASGTDMWTDVTEVVFRQPFPEGVTPIVLTEIRNPSYATSKTGQTSLSTRVFDVTNTGFKFIIYPEDAAARKVAIAQNVQYAAITPGIGMVDQEQQIIIAAGHGEDSPIYSSTMKDNNFYIYNAQGETADKELLKLYSPTILTALQTNNYPVASTLRRTNITQNDEDGKTWTTGAKIKRVLDHEIEVDGEKISSTSGLDKYSAYRDQLGWIAIATYKEGSSAPTDISTVTADKGKGLNVRIVDGRVYVDGASQFSIYSITGKKLPSNTMLTAGFYIIQANGMNKKILVK